MTVRGGFVCTILVAVQYSTTASPDSRVVGAFRIDRAGIVGSLAHPCRIPSTTDSSKQLNRIPMTNAPSSVLRRLVLRLLRSGTLSELPVATDLRMTYIWITSDRMARRSDQYPRRTLPSGYARGLEKSARKVRSYILVQFPGYVGHHRRARMAAVSVGYRDHRRIEVVQGFGGPVESPARTFPGEACLGCNVPNDSALINNALTSAALSCIASKVLPYLRMNLSE